MRWDAIRWDGGRVRDRYEMARVACCAIERYSLHLTTHPTIRPHLTRTSSFAIVDAWCRVVCQTILEIKNPIGEVFNF
jgi:hypothetical protein